ncbi:MAG TPA: cob(I)yrinic acid a,c-diamide adenosyltransferase [Thermodesulfobacteriota bacterium]|nr:cob(I)yrinic acid a,c-diamide adenosyltransferase [Thermodesulfobacteriota bacterium]
MSDSEKGMIQVYTGDGKGKTTAALGLAMRAVGHGSKVVVIQFLKGQEVSGERLTAKLLAPQLTIIPMGRAGFINTVNPDPKDKLLARKALEYAKRIVQKNACDILILDEVNVAVAYNLIPVQDLLDFMDSKPEHLELILTGRNALPKILEKADLVTEMKSLKHYYDQGVRDRVSSER